MLYRPLSRTLLKFALCPVLGFDYLRIEKENLMTTYDVSEEVRLTKK